MNNITPALLTSVKERLGPQYAMRHGLIYLARGLHWTNDDPVTGGNLLLIMLEKMAEMRAQPKLEFHDPYDMDWCCTVTAGTTSAHYADTPLEAAALALASLPPQGPGKQA
jgi:hypothetical protein